MNDLYKTTVKECNAYLKSVEKSKAKAEMELQKLDRQKEKLDERIRNLGKGQLTIYREDKAGRLTDEEYTARRNSINRNNMKLFRSHTDLESDYIDNGICLLTISAYFGWEPGKLKMDKADMENLKRIVDRIELGEDGVKLQYRLPTINVPAWDETWWESTTENA